MIDRNPGRTDLVRRARLVIEPGERDEYKSAVNPLVQEAKDAFAPLREVREKKKLLKAQAGRIQAAIEKSADHPDRISPLESALGRIRRTQTEIDSDPDLPAAREAFRRKANVLIVEVNKWRTKRDIQQGRIGEAGAIFSIRSQIPSPQGLNVFTTPDSPHRPHNALGELAIYRTAPLRPQLEAAIRTQSRAVGVEDEKSIQVPLAMTRLVPDHFIKQNQSTPFELRSPSELAKQMVGLAQLVADYDSRVLQFPSAQEVGQFSREQDAHITTYLRALLAHHLQDELTNPNRTEIQMQDYYRKFTDFIRDLARHITPHNGSLPASMEKVGLAVEGLDGIEGAMIASRVSTNLFVELGAPCLDYMGERRTAEVLRNIGWSGHWIKPSEVTETMGGYSIKNAARAVFNKIIDSLDSKVDTGEINYQQLIAPLEVLHYGEQLMINLLDIADSDQQSILLTAMRESGAFEDFINNLRRKESPYSFNIE